MVIINSEWGRCAMRKKRILGIQVVAMTVCLCITGCSAAGGTAEERHRLSVMTYSYTEEPMKGEVGRQILEKVEEYTGTELEINWVSSTNYSQKLSTVLTYSKDMPMIITMDGKSASVLYAARSGMFWDLTDLLADYPHLSQADPEINRNIMIDGRLYGVYRGRELGRVGVAYRQDWAGRLGLSAPTSIDKLEAMMKAFTFDDPDGNGIDDTYGLVLSKDQDPSALDVIMTWFGVPNGWGEDKNGELIPSFYTPEYKTALDWIREMYQMGCINPDFYMRDADHWTTELKFGRAGVLARYLDEGRRVQDYFTFENMEGKIDLVGAVEGYDGVKRTLATKGHNGFFAITKSAATLDEVQSCLDFLDKMNDPEMMVMADFGLEGRHHTFNEKGELVRSYDTQINMEYNDLNQLLTYSEYSIAPNVTIKGTELYSLQQKMYKENRQYCVKNPVLPFIQDSPTYMQEGEELERMIRDARVRYIIGEIGEEELEMVWESWREKGGIRLIEEVNSLYKLRR